MSQTCDICQCLGPLWQSGSGPLKPIMTFEPFMKWGLNYMGPIKPLTRYISNQSIIVVMDYTTKWVEAKALWDNMVQSTTKFLYEHIITCFGCPIHLVNDQGNHFINRTVDTFTQEFMITHHKSMTYYPQRNGQAKLTNKTLGKIVIKIVNSN
jgi:hypothetical protein